MAIQSRRVLAMALAAGLGVGGAAQAQEAEAERTQNLGTGVGALVGAVFGGPPGAIVGAFGGTLMGREVARERQQRAHRAQIADLQAQLQEARAQLAGDRPGPTPSPDRDPAALQIAAAEPAAVVQAGADPGSWGLALYVQFRTASAELEPHFRDQLRAVAAMLADAPHTHVILEGHADPRGGEAANLSLSRQRVAAVRSSLEAAGVAPGRIRTQAFGERRPLFRSDPRLESRGFERRVVIRIEPRETTS